MRDVTKQLVKKRGLGITKSADVNFQVVGEILQPLETELSHLEPGLSPVE